MIILRRTGFQPPQCIDGVEHLTTMKILGVTLYDNLSASTHISGVLEACSRSLYALCSLHSQQITYLCASPSHQSNHPCACPVCLSCLVGLRTCHQSVTH